MKRLDAITTPNGGYKYTQPETGVTFLYFTWAEVVQNVGKHRQANGLDTSHGWWDRLMHEVCDQQPWLGCQDDSVPFTGETALAVTGRECWRQLHEFAEKYAEVPTEDDKLHAKYFMASWRERIPRFGGCSCREDWARLEANYPPDYSSRETLVKWASNGHDWVNRRIGKPIFRPEWFETSPCKDF